METYAEEEGKMSQLRKVFDFKVYLQNDTLIGPLFLFHLELNFVCTESTVLVGELQRFVSKAQYSQRMTQKDKTTRTQNPIKVAEMMKLLANSFYDYQNSTAANKLW